MLNTENGRLSIIGLFPVPDSVPFDINDIQQMIMYREPLAILIGDNQTSSVVSGSGTIATSYLVHKQTSSLVSGSGNITISIQPDKQINTVHSGSGTVQATFAKSIQEFSNISGSGDVNKTFNITKQINSVVSGSGSVVVNTEKNIALPINVTGSGNIIQSVYINKESGDLIVTGSGNVITVHIRDFSDTNIIYIDLDAIADTLSHNLFSVSETINKEFTVYANTVPR